MTSERERERERGSGKIDIGDGMNAGGGDKKLGTRMRRREAMTLRQKRNCKRSKRGGGKANAGSRHILLIFCPASPMAPEQTAKTAAELNSKCCSTN